MEIGFPLREDVAEGRRWHDTRRDRERQAVGLASAVVRILPEDDGSDGCKRRKVQCPEDVWGRRIDRRVGPGALGADEGIELLDESDWVAEASAARQSAGISWSTGGSYLGTPLTSSSLARNVVDMAALGMH